jgi:hypothetical protein
MSEGAPGIVIVERKLDPQELARLVRLCSSVPDPASPQPHHGIRVNLVSGKTGEQRTGNWEWRMR